VYHKSYEHPSPVEIQVHPDKIEVLSFPGPLPPIDNKALKKKRIVARDYRNRKIGEFLKELHLTEGRGTGFPIIYRSLDANGSPQPVFETDEDNTFFLATLFIHPDATPFLIKEKYDIDLEEILGKINNAVDIVALSDAINLLAEIVRQGLSDRAGVRVRGRAAKLFSDIDRERVRDIVGDKVRDIEKVKAALEFCKTAKTREELLDKIELKNVPVSFNRYIKPLVAMKYIAMTHPDKPSTPNQRYRTTETGEILMEFLKDK
jgi:ATP-dependent DNA helicase RecG